MSIDDRLRADGAAWRETVQMARPHTDSLRALPAPPALSGCLRSASLRSRRDTHPIRPPRAAWMVSSAVLIVVAFVVVTAVFTRGGDDAPSVFGLPVSPARTDSQRPVPAPAIHDPGAVRILTTRPVGYLLSMPWELVGLRNNARTLVVHYVGGDGVRPGGIYAIGFRVIDTPTSVELIAVSRNDNPGTRSSGASLQIGYGTITLPKPITGRALLHAPSDTSYPASLLR